MSKYINDLAEQLKGKNIRQFTKELKASQNISKILKDQHEAERQLRVKKNIKKILQGY